MYKQAAQAYQKTSQVAVSPRELEANLLMKAAARLQLIKDEWEESSLAEKDDALVYNRKLWSILVTSATSAESQLPQDIKNNIASLGVFIFKQTMTVMTSDDSNKLTSIININRAIAEGLRAQAE
ncbi:MAG: flagellar biosynthesis regulator FlaF [Roseibium sp.]|uniref:flagellar biosynthesis regulator FlaF n=1 Tax=Roseibium sp. TaxID=1936156 RepID=UPI001B1D5444|nr:flagellar biosynthesis regulator FlaF [Roseibium sp.]MBO6893283.1 flagellar biosynthesis regulator FlaF [Roseibium sp.]MBO6932750.1 flagellar biosynthesis regulator FlaF [Roseibium sp.]